MLPQRCTTVSRYVYHQLTCARPANALDNFPRWRSRCKPILKRILDKKHSSCRPQNSSQTVPKRVCLLNHSNYWGRLAAIALGSVLYSTGLKYVRERVLRRHYGIITKVDFEEGKHPPNLRIIDLDGKVKCRDVVHWFARKVNSANSQLLS
jgi:hypothetical protein